ncbi:SUMF1/EgtB/PvdO family nonheme iron enzyme [Luteolibacter yonseiensis]|uniref:SUMF1/EgtB/PvdO family nonheme iron enzyme n=1 Tax=Luteolibacter yonseiensis TaxID=1144680 RepID=A0A934V604_9BACT|nr:SUMF1/EgtB/PvdO family nonheme iron enzyme [Luteolibacter yonseiensis]MBK1814507.1 SUMF1/EgtB/PvdO family nonheme iron enzyme [Luteolibacter yonseiensis]
MNPAPDERHLGEYRLRELLAENATTRTWLAEQISVARLVLVDELTDENERGNFLADVRAKAGVDHPLVGSVYEAVAEPGACFYAHELLPGTTLEQRRLANDPFPPARLAMILRRVSEAHLQHESLGQATSPMGLDAVYLDEHAVIRLKNLAIAGIRTPEESVRDVFHLGHALVPLVASTKPGATRLLTLLSWMRGEGLEGPLTWAQTRDFCMQIEHQLADPPSVLTPTKGGSRSRKKLPASVIFGATAAVLVGIVAVSMTLRPPLPTAPPRAKLPDAVPVPAGEHPTPDDSQETLPAFRISAHEVTIGQYEEFLTALSILAKEKRADIFDPASQPKDKPGHIPDDWDSLLAAAKSNGSWKNQPVTLDSPVTGVDWWDASAYAEWKKARLPTQEEWFAALSQQLPDPATIPTSSFAPVSPGTADRTPTGLLGMAGSACEWTAKPAPDPANPLGEKLWVIIGGSYLKSGSNALTREWTADRGLRRPDLGFRVVFE